MIAPDSRRLGQFAAAALTAGLVLAFAAPTWPALDLRPGSPLGQSIGIIAALLMIGSLAYLPLRRSSSSLSKPRMQYYHSFVGTLAVVLALVHSGASMRQWSTLVLLAVLALLVTGLYGRLVSPRRLGTAFGRAALPYAATTGRPAGLGHILDAKRRVLQALEPGARESEFVLRTRHWRHPLLAWRYHRLSASERRLIASMQASGSALVARPERFWRGLHLVFAGLFLIGLLAHVITTVFFAGYVASGREVYWWHLTQW